LIASRFRAKIRALAFFLLVKKVESACAKLRALRR